MPKTTKGILYDIKNAKGHTIGYLFGTMHVLAKEYLERLHPQILERFNQSDQLFVEIIDDFRYVACNERANPLDSAGVDDFLICKALMQKKQLIALKHQILGT